MLFVATMLVCLSFGAALLLGQVTGTASVSGSAIRKVRTDKAASAGLVQACSRLESLLYPSATGSLSLAGVQALPPLATGDPLCADGVDCSQWRLLADSVDSGTDGQKARLAVTCSPNCLVDPKAVVNFLVRSRGVLDGQGGLLLEATLDPTGT